MTDELKRLHEAARKDYGLGEDAFSGRGYILTPAEHAEYVALRGGYATGDVICLTEIPERVSVKGAEVEWEDNYDGTFTATLVPAKYQALVEAGEAMRAEVEACASGRDRYRELTAAARAWDKAIAALKEVSP